MNIKFEEINTQKKSNIKKKMKEVKKIVNRDGRVCIVCRVEVH